MELSSSNVKKHSYIFSYISENETLHFLGQTLQIEINPPGEKRKRKSRKNVSEKLLIIQEVTFRA